MKNPIDEDPQNPWTRRPGFWDGHPLLTWTLQFAMAVPIILVVEFFFRPCWWTGNPKERYVSDLVTVSVVVVLLVLKEHDRRKRGLRPSPWFFWW
jgi:hypothetical protein